MAQYINKVLVYDGGKNRKIAAGDELQLKSADETKLISLNGATGIVSAEIFSGSGASLTALPIAELTSADPGVEFISDSLLAPNLLRKDAASNTLTGNLIVNGNLNVVGDIISGGSVNVVLQDQFLDLNGNNLLGAATAGGVAVNVLSTGTTFDVESFTAGGTGTDPTIVVSGNASALVDGDLIQVSQSASANEGQYIVYSASYNSGTGKTTVTLYGNAASAHPASAYPQLPFVHNQLTTATESAKLTAITVGVMAVSGGALYAVGPAQIEAGTWCYAYGAKVSDFENKWISLAPVATATLQQIYNASSPAEIFLADSKDFQIRMPVSGTAAINLEANAPSSINIDGAELNLTSTRFALNNGNVILAAAGGIDGVTTGVVAEGTICYVNGSGAAVASDQASVSDAALEVDGVVTATAGDLATVAGSRVRVLYTGTAPVVGDVVYLAGGANAGKCQVALPTSGRVTKLGKCVVNGAANICTIVWAPEYIADL